MAMRPEQQVRFESWLREKCSTLRCAMCQSVRWKIGDLPVPAHVNPADKPVAEEPLLAQLICKNCAHVVWFDLRLVNADADQDPAKTMFF
jgi:hypothetical protein